MKDTFRCSQELSAGSDNGDEAEVSRCHDAFSPEQASGDSPARVLSDLDRLRAELAVARQRLGILEAERSDLERSIGNLTALVSTDELTGLRNRHRFMEDLESACSFAARQNLLLSLVVLNLDDFRAYNESFGEAAGDQVLRILARILTDATRAYDAVARYGGGAFAVLLPSTDRFDACRIADRLRQALIEYDWPLRSITASFGVTTMESSSIGPRELFDQAKFAVRQAKREGRNHVVHFAEAPDRSMTKQASAENGRHHFEHSLT